MGGAVEALREDGFEEEVVVFEEQLQQRGDGISTTSMGAVSRSGVPWLWDLIGTEVELVDGAVVRNWVSICYADEVLRELLGLPTRAKPRSRIAVRNITWSRMLAMNLHPIAYIE